MIFMVLFWIILGFNLLFYIFGKKYYPFKTINEWSIILLILSFSFLFVAIITKDPIFSTFGVPPEFEWIVGLFITGLTSWKLYFNPLKERVIKTEQEVSAVKTEVLSIKSDTTMIKEKIMTVKMKLTDHRSIDRWHVRFAHKKIENYQFSVQEIQLRLYFCTEM